MMLSKTTLSLTASITPLLAATTIAAQSTVDLGSWTAESYNSVSGFPAGSWNVAPGGGSVVQAQNGQPTMFISDFDSHGTEIRGNISVNAGDDDYIGFVLGIQPGDTMNSSAEYLLVDWKGGTQSFNFSAPSCTPGATAPRGLAVSRVFGIPTADEFWGHVNFDEPACSNLANGLEELQRGATLGNTGWSTNTMYEFAFEFGPERLIVTVDDVQQLDITGVFANGRIGFYNFSQAGVEYSAFTILCLPEVEEFGGGTTGLGGVPGLTALTDPLFGLDLRLNVGNSAGAQTLACLAFSDSVAAGPHPFWGNRILIRMPFMVVIPMHALPAVGQDIVLPIPNDPALCAYEFFGQLGVCDTAADLGVAFSRGLRLRIGQPQT